MMAKVRLLATLRHSLPGPLQHLAAPHSEGLKLDLAAVTVLVRREAESQEVDEPAVAALQPVAAPTRVDPFSSLRTLKVLHSPLLLFPAPPTPSPPTIHPMPPGGSGRPSSALKLLTCTPSVHAPVAVGWPP